MEAEAPLRLRWQMIALLAVLAIFALPVDVVLAQFFMSDPLPGELRSLIHKAEFFGHAYGILGISFTIYLINVSRRRQLFRLIASALMAGIACDAIKVVVHRVRPVDFSFAEGQSTFLGLSVRHVDSLGEVFNSAYHSFPSAHTATSVAFALALGGMYPQASRWFLWLAGMVALSRVDGGAHFMSDTFVGAIVGYATGCWLLGDTRLSTWFSEFEAGRSIQMWPSRPLRPAFMTKPDASQILHG